MGCWYAIGGKFLYDCIGISPVGAIKAWNKRVASTHKIDIDIKELIK